LSTSPLLPPSLSFLFSEDDDRDELSVESLAGMDKQISVTPWYAEAGGDGLGKELSGSTLSQDDATGASWEDDASGHQHSYRHHPFLPLKLRDIIGLLFTALGLMIAAGGGIGMYGYRGLAKSYLARKRP